MFLAALVDAGVPFSVLEKAVTAEDFELAAGLRDEIKSAKDQVAAHLREEMKKAEDAEHRSPKAAP